MGLPELSEERHWVESTIDVGQRSFLIISKYAASQEALIGRLRFIIDLVYPGSVAALTDKLQHRLKEVDIESKHGIEVGQGFVSGL